MLVGIPGWRGSGDFLRLFLCLRRWCIVSSGKRGNLGGPTTPNPQCGNPFQGQTYTNTRAVRGIETQVMTGGVHFIASEREDKVSR